MLTTEQLNQEHAELDLYDTTDLVKAFVTDQLNAVQAVQRTIPSLVGVVEAAVPRIAAGGRLIYVGAGTSGRLGLLDCVELHPTFSWDRKRAIALMAGGPEALYQAVEGAEDNREAGATDLQHHNPGVNDVVFLLAASGRTPYVLGACDAAKSAGALTVAIVNNVNAPISAQSDFSVVLDTGAEVISGSTRLKAGTAQKIALNTLSSSIMVRLHKVYGNLMVDMKATNVKLVRRAIQLTMRAANVDQETARIALESCGFQIKVAIVALICGINPEAATQRLAAAHGSVRIATKQEG